MSRGGVAAGPPLLDSAAVSSDVTALGTDGVLEVSRPATGVVLVDLVADERRNVMDGPATEAWVRLVDGLEELVGPGVPADDEVRCVVLAARGRAFSGGGDVRWIGSEPDATVDELRDRMLRYYRRWLRLRELEVPLLAAVQGHAVGAGAVLALLADVRYASPSARLSVPFLRLGMHPGMATTWLLPQVVGLAAATDLLLTGRAVDGEEMVRLGLASRLVDDERLREEVLAVAADVALAAPVATRLTLSVLRRGGHAGVEDAVQWEGLAQPVTLATQDLQEGLAARRERRPPRFTGR